MTRTIRYLVATLALVAVEAHAQSQEIVLHAGNLLNCTLAEPDFSSRSAAIGEPVTCYAYPLREFGYSVFPWGSYLTRRFVDYRDPGPFVGKGCMKLEFDRLILSPTTEIPIATKVVGVRGYRLDADGRIIGHGHPRRDAFEWMLPILWPVKLLTPPCPRPVPNAQRRSPHHPPPDGRRFDSVWAAAVAEPARAT